MKTVALILALSAFASAASAWPVVGHPTPLVCKPGAPCIPPAK